MLSNIELMREFVGESIQKKEVLLANSSLQAQMAYKTNQLIAKKEGVVATSQLTATSSEFLIHATSSYWELMNQTLADYSYIFTGEIDGKGFYSYQYRSLPPGYKLHCTKSVLLWQTWWKYRKYATKIGIPLDILVQIRDSWYGIKDLNISDGLLYIQTLVSETEFHSDDLVIWLSRIEPNSET
ncbi:hypothetical protein [Calothrix sp. PCC 7507]|uniref:hypothetical protein n=1 Tax=Calothrix sp. PCC 7507 TaxID=99598 RepID=UPI00029F4AD7|nr:hypothetical protein [Calothrix sp. PCC 7507]AFY35589.1 hypothetical protein Cal7507_5249 [Calothrix sp. PCC 7507]